jgi:hypothetical protein
LLEATFSPRELALISAYLCIQIGVPVVMARKAINGIRRQR